MTRWNLIFIVVVLVCVWTSNSVGEPVDDMENDDDDHMPLDRRQDENSTSISTSASAEDTVSQTSPVGTTTVIRTSTAPSPSDTTSESNPPTTPETPITTRNTLVNSDISSAETSAQTFNTATQTQNTATSANTANTRTTLRPTTTRLTTRATTTPSTSIIITRSNNADVTLTSTVQVVGSVVETVPTASGSSTTGQASFNSGGPSSGLSTSSRNIVIGVVVGVGGAILFGGLFIVAWRLRKKKTAPIDQDDLTRRDGSPLVESRRDMHSVSPDASPFQATLDQYHKPGPVNASSNF